MNEQTIKARALDFLKAHPLCVISTIHADGSGPESAVVAFAETENLEIIFGTSNTSRKYKNLQKDNRVSFVIGWSNKEGTIQYEGAAAELSGEETNKYAAVQVEKIPSSKDFVGREDQRWFIVKPTWLRFLDNALRPPDTYELKF